MNLNIGGDFQICISIPLILFLLKSSENLWFSDDIRGNKRKLIRLNLLNIRSTIWKQTYFRSYKNLLQIFKIKNMGISSLYQEKVTRKKDSYLFFLNSYILHRNMFSLIKKFNSENTSTNLIEGIRIYPTLNSWLFCLYRTHEMRTFCHRINIFVEA